MESFQLLREGQPCQSGFAAVYRYQPIHLPILSPEHRYLNHRHQEGDHRKGNQIRFRVEQKYRLNSVYEVKANKRSCDQMFFHVTFLNRHRLDSDASILD